MTRTQERPPGSATTLRTLVGSGDRIGLFTLPFLVVGIALNVAFPGVVRRRRTVGGPARPVHRPAGARPRHLGLVGRADPPPGPRGELITTGPYRLCKHLLYTGVALLVIPWLGFLLNTWLGVIIGLALYVGSRRYAPIEEQDLAEEFGPAWDDYAAHVALPWL